MRPISTRPMFTPFTANSSPVNAQVKDPGKESFAALPLEIQNKIHNKVVQQSPHRSSELRNFALVCRGTYNAALLKLRASHLLNQVNGIPSKERMERPGEFNNILQQAVREDFLHSEGKAAVLAALAEKIWYVPHDHKVDAFSQICPQARKLNDADQAKVLVAASKWTGLLPSENRVDVFSQICAQAGELNDAGQAQVLAALVANINNLNEGQAKVDVFNLTCTQAGGLNDADRAQVLLAALSRISDLPQDNQVDALGQIRTQAGELKLNEADRAKILLAASACGLADLPQENRVEAFNQIHTQACELTGAGTAEVFVTLVWSVRHLPKGNQSDALDRIELQGRKLNQADWTDKVLPDLRNASDGYDD